MHISTHVVSRYVTFVQIINVTRSELAPLTYRSLLCCTTYYSPLLMTHSPKSSLGILYSIKLPSHSIGNKGLPSLYSQHLSWINSKHYLPIFSLDGLLDVAFYVSYNVPSRYSFLCSCNIDSPLQFPQFYGIIWPLSLNGSSKNWYYMNFFFIKVTTATFEKNNLGSNKKY